MRRSYCRKGFRKDKTVLLRGTTFMSLEDAVKHYMTDGNVNLPQAPEGAFEYDSAPDADHIRECIGTDFDRFDAAVSIQNGSIIQPSPVSVPVSVDVSSDSSSAPSEPSIS